MNNINTAEQGFFAIQSAIERLGGRNIIARKEGSRRFFTFTSPDGNTYKITTRAKRSGTWQTSITYGKPRKENLLEKEYWVFVDLAFDPPKFYPVPLWWIENNIYEVHQEYLKRNQGHRPRNDDSNHHGIPLKRIEQWKDAWAALGFTNENITNG
jgi:hypothetical protein